jgi:hypothetical protein
MVAMWLSMNCMMYSLERFSLTSAFAGLRRDKPALSRKERENNSQVVWNVK